MTTYLIIQTIVLAVAAGLFVYANFYRCRDRKDLCLAIGFSILGVFAMDVLAIIMFYGINR